MDKSDFALHLERDQRLVILRLLDDAGPSLNDSVLHEGLRRKGYTRLIRQDVIDHIRMLERAQAVTTTVDGNTLVAEITPQGRRAARGTVRIEGVAVPGQE